MSFLSRYLPRKNPALPADIDSRTKGILEAIRPYTLTSIERQLRLIESVKYIERYGIPGAIVECGVYRGGSMMAVALTLLSLGNADRHLYLFDTFEGMPSPTAEDVDLNGRSAKSQLEDVLCVAHLEDVKRAVLGTGYPVDRTHFVKGMVEDTIPAQGPDGIALLRLDTDWYESTRHELIHLYPRLAKSGVLIIDDYGHWRGARRAVDEYIETLGEPILLNPIDYTARIAVKT